MTKEQQIAFMNEDGTIKTKEQFLQDVGVIYDDFKESLDNEACDCERSSFEYLADPDNIVEPEAILQSYDFMDRSVFITDEIEMSHANSIFEVLKFWNNIDEMDGIPPKERKPICIYINTPGGSLDATFSIISSIKLSKTPVYTYVIGTAYSGGFFIAISGHRRFGFPHSSYMFHEGSVMDGGDAHKFIQHVEFYKAQLKRIKKIVLDNTNISSSEYRENKTADWFMDAEEALSKGVIDEIIEDFYPGDDDDYEE